MKRKYISFLAVSFFLLIISSCLTVVSTATPTKPVIKQSSPTLIPSTSAISFFLNSNSFQAGTEIPKIYAHTGCGKNTSPSLAWGGIPENTQSLVVQVSDRDANNFIHWLVFNIPTTLNGFPEGELAKNIPQGTNDFGLIGWGGPCPPSGTHHYVFTLIALDTILNLPEGIKWDQLLSAIQGHIVGQTSFTALFSRN
jgi:Raf kinase inhibitor-like YbhB/YbcL family protein